MPPGRHYFYFLRSGSYYFLSPKFDIVRFKDTHICLNQIVVNERHQPLAEHKIKKNKEAYEDRRFNKERSVFKAWKEENDAILKKMYQSDMSYSKLHRILKNNQEEMKEV